MTDEAKADALEDEFAYQLNLAKEARRDFRAAAEVEQQIQTRNCREGVGNLFLWKVRARLLAASNRALQSANPAMKNGTP